MQQPASSLPDPLLPMSGDQAHVWAQAVDAAELDLGYEGAFPFLAGEQVTDPGRC